MDNQERTCGEPGENHCRTRREPGEKQGRTCEEPGENLYRTRGEPVEDQGTTRREPIENQGRTCGEPVENQWRTREQPGENHCRTSGALTKSVFFLTLAHQGLEASADRPPQGLGSFSPSSSTSFLYCVLSFQGCPGGGPEPKDPDSCAAMATAPPDSQQPVTTH